MKKIFKVICILMFLLAENGYSQLTYSKYHNIYFKKFLSTKTIVPIIGIENVDSKIEETLGEAWNFNELKFVPINEITQYQENDSFSIINLLSISYNNGSFGNTSLSLFFSADLEKTSMMNIIASVPVNCSFNYLGEFTTECGFQQIEYKIDILILQLIEVVNFVKNNKYNPVSDEEHKYVLKFNQNSIKKNKKIAFKKFLISEDIFNENMDLIEFKEYFRYETKIVSKIEYEEILNSEDKSYFVILHSNNPYFLLSVFDLETNETLYLGEIDSVSEIVNPKKGTKLNKKHLTELNKFLKKI